ncbi:MAG: hypothetical protein ACLTQL_12270 [Eisenbergiella sp.]
MDTVEKRFLGEKVPKIVMFSNWIDEKEIYLLDVDNDKVLEFKKKYELDISLSLYILATAGYIMTWKSSSR